jgi:ABC-type lipoprotein release transport system permease subunit
MTFKEISFQMLRNNYKKYLLYFCCNVFAIALFYTFAAIYTNEEFMNPAYVDKSISGNIYAPCVMTAVFMFLFIPYSYGVFLKKRKNEYGILMSLGMNEKEIWVSMIFDNIAVSTMSLACGLLGGTFLSLLFFEIIKECSGISGLAWKFNMKSYGITTVVYLAVVFVTLLLHIISFIKIQIADMFKARWREERDTKSSGFFIILGALISSVAVIWMMDQFGYRTTDIWLISPIFLGIGSWMILSNVTGFIIKHKRSTPEQIKKVHLGKSFVMQHFRSYKIVSFIAGWLFGIIILFGGCSAVAYPSLLNYAMSYSPYDLLYIQVHKNNDMSVSEAKQLLEKYNVTVTDTKEIAYMRNGAFNLLSTSEVNQLAGCSYAVNQGEYLVIYQYDLKDGYAHQMNLTQNCKFNLGTEDLELKYAGQDVRILFNHNHGFADRTLVLNDEDYKRVEEQADGYYSGIIKCFSLDDWQNSKEGANVLQQTLSDRNHLDISGQFYYKITSKLETYETAKKSAQFLIIVLFFVMSLFYVSANAIIFFKIQGEMEDEERMYRGLFRIGISEKEMQNIIRYKNVFYCLIPLLFGCTIGTFYNYTTNTIAQYRIVGIEYCSIISAFLLSVQCGIIILLSHYEKKKLGV